MVPGGQARALRFFLEEVIVVNRLPILLLLAIPVITFAEDDGNELLDFM